jgi:hypothetical protein
MYLTRGPLAQDEITRRFWWRFHRRELIVWTVALGIVIGLVLVTAFVLHENSACDSHPFACNLSTEIIGTGIVAGIGALFFVWKLRRIVRSFAEVVREHSDSLLGVEKPSSLAGHEGYDDLFTQLARDLLTEQASRVQTGLPSECAPVQGKLITAGAGSGKTTALVYLAEFLARHQVVPIPISLRGQAEPVNLVELARQQFCSSVVTRTAFGDQGDRVLARLRARGQVVILADGLDEAMPGASRSQRELALTAAIRDALESRIAVIATWRSADLGRELPLSRIELPKLEGFHAVEFLCGNPDADTPLAETILAAELSETPFYLTIAEPLVQAGVLVDWKGDEMFGLRVGLLDRYVDALCDGTVLPEADLLPDATRAGGDRRVVIEGMSGLALGMIGRRSASVRLDKVQDWIERPVPGGPAGGGKAVNVHGLVEGGRSLGLFELGDQETGQFTHSVMQSYLASRVIREDSEVIEKLIHAAPTHEVRTALVMAAAWRKENESTWDRQQRGREIAGKLIAASSDTSDRSAVGLLAAAAKIVMACDLGPDFRDEIARRAEQNWDAADALPKLEAIAAFAPMATASVYRVFRNALDDLDFRVARAAAKALADGGEAAYVELQTELAGILDKGGTVAPHERKELETLAYVMPLLRGGDGGGFVPELGELIPLVGEGLSPAAEGALARGFRRDAWLHRDELPRPVDPDALFAVLDEARWWYSRLCLLQALTLRADARNEGAVRERLSARAEDVGEHPFVREAATQCLLGLDDSAGVWRWVWRDESAVVKHARPTRRRDTVSHRDLAIPAVQLAADVALAMNLTFSTPPDGARTDDERRAERERRAQKWLVHDELPHCIGRSLDRHELFPPEGECPQGCAYNFCPLRWEGAGALWNDFSEAFCRQQRDVLPRKAHLASWQQAEHRRDELRRRMGLRRFWEGMAEEARRASASRLPGPH